MSITVFSVFKQGVDISECCHKVGHALTHEGKVITYPYLLVLTPEAEAAGYELIVEGEEDANDDVR